MDYVRYSAGYASEKRSILAVHRETGDEFPFKTRTEFYGRSKAKNGGWLGEQNLTRSSPFSVDDFDILDIQTPEPIENTLHTAKMMTEGILKTFGTKNWKGWYGAGESFRVARSSIIGYKVQRQNNLKPLAIDDITDYLVKKYNIIPCYDLEADDWIVIEGQKPNTVVVTHDKDGLGTHCFVWNPQKPELGVRDCRGFGAIWLDSKKELRGYGRKWFYAQVALGDSVDNFFANSATEAKWGDASAYKALEHAKNDRECLQALVGVYKHLYPSPKRIRGWRDEVFEIDWLYVMQENWTMAHMKRTEHEKEIVVSDVLTKLKVEF